MLIQRRKPINYTEEDSTFFKNELEKELSFSYSYSKYKNAVVTFHGAAFCNRKLIVENLISPSHKSEFNLSYYIKTLLFKKKKVADPSACVLIFDFWSSGYFHWITDALPRLLNLQKSVDLNKVVILLPDNGIDFQKDTLRIMGYESFLLIPPKSYVKVEELFIPHFVTKTGNYDEEVIKELRDLFIAKIVAKSTKPRKRVYISRRLAKRRKIENEEVLISLLKKWDFEVVDFEAMSFFQQVELMAQVEVLVGQHGAGLVNMLFMQRGAAVMEFRLKGDETNLCYFSLASALDLKYYYQFCTGHGAGKNTFDSDVVVDICLMEDNLKLMLNAIS